MAEPINKSMGEKKMGNYAGIAGIEIEYMGIASMYARDMVRVISEAVFSLFLFVVSWQDLRRKRIRVLWLYGFGMVGIGFTLIRGVQAVLAYGWDWKQHGVRLLKWMIGMMPGLILLWMERQTGGAVGLGDGWFFLIAGCYLGGWQTLELLMGAVFVSSLLGCIWMAAALLGGKGNGLWERMRKKKLPFLPCVIPVWIWMLVASVG